MRNKLVNTIIESTVRKALKEAKESPERSIRNLVDLGLYFSTGEEEQHFLGAVRDMLQDENSAYYPLAEDMVSHIDEDTLTAFGMNVGYQSCVVGAQRIRSLKAKENVKIPWFLSFHVDRESFLDHEKDYGSVISQGKDMGIHTYLFFADSVCQEMLDLFAEFRDCAFILFIRGSAFSEKLYCRAGEIHNMMAAVEAGSGCKKICEAFRKQKCLYGLYTICDRERMDDGITRSYLDQALKTKSSFLIYISEEDCGEAEEMQLYHFVKEARESQKYPFIVLDLKQDGSTVNKIISGEGYPAIFDKTGHLLERGKNMISESIFECGLRNFLKT